MINRRNINFAALDPGTIPNCSKFLRKRGQNFIILTGKTGQEKGYTEHHIRLEHGFPLQPRVIFPIPLKISQNALRQSTLICVLIENLCIQSRTVLLMLLAVSKVFARIKVIHKGA